MGQESGRSAGQGVQFVSSEISFHMGQQRETVETFAAVHIHVPTLVFNITPLHLATYEAFCVHLSSALLTIRLGRVVREHGRCSAAQTENRTAMPSEFADMPEHSSTTCK